MMEPRAERRGQCRTPFKRPAGVEKETGDGFCITRAVKDSVWQFRGVNRRVRFTVCPAILGRGRRVFQTVVPQQVFYRWGFQLFRIPGIHHLA